MTLEIYKMYMVMVSHTFTFSHSNIRYSCPSANGLLVYLLRTLVISHGKLVSVAISIKWSTPKSNQKKILIKRNYLLYTYIYIYIIYYIYIYICYFLNYSTIRIMYYCSIISILVLVI